MEDDADASGSDDLRRKLREIGGTDTFAKLDMRSQRLLAFGQRRNHVVELLFEDRVTSAGVGVCQHAHEVSGVVAPEVTRSVLPAPHRFGPLGVEGHGVTIHSPLINLTKAQIIAQGLQLGVDYSQTTSCYDPASNGDACGSCDACLLRLRGFSQNGIDDPIRYQQLD